MDRLRREVPVDQVRRRCGRGIDDRRVDAPRPTLSRHTQLRHEPGHALLVNVDPPSGQGGMDPWRAARATACGMDLADRFLEPCLLCRVALPSGVVPGTGDLQDPEEHGDRVAVLLRVDKPEALHRVVLSLAKKAAPFWDVPLLSQDAVLPLELVDLDLLRRRQVPGPPFPCVGLSLTGSSCAAFDPRRQIVLDLLDRLPVLRTKSTARVRNSLGYGGSVFGTWIFLQLEGPANLNLGLST